MGSRTASDRGAVSMRRWLPRPRILHPWPGRRFAVTLAQGGSPVRESRTLGSVRGCPVTRIPTAITGGPKASLPPTSERRGKAAKSGHSARHENPGIWPGSWSRSQCESYATSFFRRIAARPATPRPSSARVAGSETKRRSTSIVKVYEKFTWPVGPAV